MLYRLQILNNEGEEMTKISTNDFDNLKGEVRHFKNTPTYIDEHEKELNQIPF